MPIPSSRGAEGLRAQPQGAGKPERPIVMLPRRQGPAVAPGTGTVETAVGNATLQGSRREHHASNYATPMARFGGPAGGSE